MAKQQQQQWRYVLSGEKFTRQKRQYPIAYLVLQSVSQYLCRKNTPRQQLLSILDDLLWHEHDHNCPSHGQNCLVLSSYVIQSVSSRDGRRERLCMKNSISSSSCGGMGYQKEQEQERRGEKMEKWKRSHFFARQQHQGTDACGTSELSRKNGLMMPMLCLLLSSLLWMELPPLFFFFYGSRCTTTRLPCQRSKKTNKKRTVLPCIDNRRINQWQLHRRYTHSQKSLKKPGQRIRKVARKTIKKKQKSLLRGSEIAFEICEEIEYPIKDSCHTQM